MKKVKTLIMTAVFLLGIASTTYSSTCLLIPGSYDNDGWCNPVPDGWECQPWGSAVQLPNCNNDGEGSGGSDNL